MWQMWAGMSGGTPGAPAPHSWLFVPFLHAAVGRLSPEAGPGAVPSLHSSRLTRCRCCLSSTQCACCSSSLPMKAVQCRCLRSRTAAANLLRAPTLVRLPWVWVQSVQPDGYIPATAQEAFPHVFFGESAASNLVQTTNRAPPPREPAAPAGPFAAKTTVTIHTAPQKVTAPRQGLSPAVLRPSFATIVPPEVPAVMPILRLGYQTKAATILRRQIPPLRRPLNWTHRAPQPMSCTQPCPPCAGLAPWTLV